MELAAQKCVTLDNYGAWKLRPTYYLLSLSGRALPPPGLALIIIYYLLFINILIIDYYYYFGRPNLFSINPPLAINVNPPPPWTPP